MPMPHNYVCVNLSYVVLIIVYKNVFYVTIFEGFTKYVFSLGSQDCGHWTCVCICVGLLCPNFLNAYK